MGKIRKIISECQLTGFIELEETIRSCVYGYWSVQENGDDYETIIHEYVDQWMSNWNDADHRTFVEHELETKALALVRHLVDLKPAVWNAFGIVVHEILQENVTFMGVMRVVGDHIVLMFEYDT